MKKKFIFLLFIFLIIITSYSIIYLSYNIDEDKIIKTINTYLLNEVNANEKISGKCKIASKYYGFSRKNISSFYVDAGSMIGCFEKKENKVVISYGSSMTYRFIVKVKNGEYQVITYEIIDEVNADIEKIKNTFPDDIIK